METKISIIISEDKDNTYLTRCLNSIRRQTFRNYEIISPGDIADAAGEYIFFCTPTCILTENVLEELLSAAEQNPDICSSACVLEKKKTDFSANPDARFGLYGHLFKKSLLDLSDGVITNLPAVFRYLDNFSGIRIDTDALIYETDTSHSFAPISPEEFGGCIKTLKKLQEPAESAVEFYRNCIPVEPGSARELTYAAVFAQVYPEETALNFSIAKNSLSAVYKSCCENINTEEFETLRQYLLLWKSNRVFTAAAFELLKIPKKKQYAFFTCSLKDFLFYDENTSDTDEADNTDGANARSDQGEIIKKINLMESRIRQLENELAKLKKNSGKPASSPAASPAAKAPAASSVPKAEAKPPVKNPEQPAASPAPKAQAPIRQPYTELMYGQELINFVVRKYSQGNLGFKTLLQSFKAWMKYKTARKKN